MDTSRSNRSNRVAKLVTAGFALLVLMGFAQTASAASVSADHVIRNTVSATYRDLNDFDPTSGAGISATVDITVELVQVSPEIVLSSTQTDVFDPVSATQVVNIFYTITSQANGTDTYTLAGTLNDTGGVTGSSPTDPANYVLGATTAASAVTSFETGTVTATNGTNILVPADSVGNDFKINELVVTDKIRLAMTGVAGDNVCEVLSITEPGAGSEANATSTIEVHKCTDGGSGNGGTGELAIGDQIGEQAEILLIVTVGTAPTDGTVEVDVSIDVLVENDGAVAPATLDNSPILNVLAANLEIYKYVRNVSDVVVGDEAAAYDVLNINGTLYYRSGVTGSPGDTLEYAVLLLNQGGDIQKVIATDPEVPFTNYSTGFGIKLYEEETLADPACASFTCVATFGGTFVTNDDDVLTTNNDHGGLDGTTITVYPGVGGNEVGAIGGNIDANKVSIILYQLVIAN